MAKYDGGRPAPDGYQYGVRFRDGSVAARWNGRTQQQRAREHLAWLLSRYADPFTLVRREPGGPWEPVR